MEIERDWSKAQAIRPSVSAEIGETVTAAIAREVREEPGFALPHDLVSLDGRRIEDALSGQAMPFIR